MRVTPARIKTVDTLHTCTRDMSEDPVANSTTPSAESNLPKTRAVKRAGGTGRDARRSVGRVRPNASTTPAPRAGMHSGLTVDEALAEGLRVIQIDPSALIPHPFNPPGRSAGDQQSATWTELVDSVAANGVRIAAKAVTRRAFTLRWPGALDSDAVGEYVLTYGHRRRAAALTTGTATMPVIIDDSELDLPDGGLLAMYDENQRREDLSPLDEAGFLARITDELKLTQRELAERLGLNQATVSRRLSLLLLSPPLRDAVSDGSLSPTEAATLAAKLPHGPVRSWQKDPDNDQDTDLRLTEQVRAYQLTQVSQMLPKQAAERVIAERNSRAKARDLGITLVDPVAYFGDAASARARRVYDEVTPDPDKFVATLDETGALAFYSIETLDENDSDPDWSEDDGDTSGSSAHESHEADTSVPEAGPRSAPTDPLPEKSSLTRSASKRIPVKERRVAVQRIAADPPGRTELLHILAEQHALGIFAECDPSAVYALASTWSPVIPQSAPRSAKAQIGMAWAVALAAYEVHASARSTWTALDKSYYGILRERAKYEPGPVERERLDGITGGDAR